MKKLYLMLFTLSMSVIFYYIPDKGALGFPLNRVSLTYNQYAWAFFEHAIKIILAYIIWDSASKYKDATLVFLWIMIADLVNFFLAYDDVLRNYFITFNIVKLVLFFIVVSYEFKVNRYGEFRDQD